MSASLTPTASLPPSDYIIIGGTGDLSLRKIFPAFFWRYLDSQLTDEYRLFATSRATLSVAEFAEKLRPFCESAFADEAYDSGQMGVHPDHPDRETGSVKW